MIDDPLPTDWRDLQTGVCRLFNDIGLSARTDVPLQTPRGTVSVDVFAIDEGSVDKIEYLVECKNWAQAVPQTIVHAFTTVMQETGANIGFIVSRVGLQAGATRYTEYTNITGLTYADLQRRYFRLWWERCFCPPVAQAADVLLQYVEPINSRRTRFLNSMSDDQIEKYVRLRGQYDGFAMVMGMLSPTVRVFTQRWSDPPESLDDYKLRLAETFPDMQFRAETFRALAQEICTKLAEGEAAFHDLFGRNIFED